MNRDRFQRVKEIFAAAADLPSAERDGFLAQACGTDHELEQQVRALLLADADPVDMPDPVVQREQLEGLWDGEPRLPAIPGFRPLRLLGEGGMGEVYLAEQEFPRRQVAIKLVRGASFSATALRRFREEVQLLGRLQHPGITQVYAADTDAIARGGRPYFAMEYVDGCDLISYAREQRLDSRARLQLIVDLCLAVDYAHSQGVVHRDLKPGNVLVDRSGQVKVLDFGIARAVGPEFETRTLLTGSEHVVGTMGYMAPEQFEGRATAIGPQADVYAIGVLLFEMLTGKLPHDLEGLNLYEAGRCILETEATLLSTLERRLRGDVETIVGSALARDPHLRYASAAALSEDLRRHLAGEAVLARPPSRLYLARKFVQRNRRPLGLTAAALALGVSLASLFRQEGDLFPRPPDFDWSWSDFRQGQQRQFQLLGPGPSSRFGTAMAAVGDMDGDTVADFVVGGQWEAVDGIAVGGVTAVSGRTGTTLHRAFGRVDNGKFGMALAGAGDLDHDGHADYWAMTGELSHPQGGVLRAVSGASGADLIEIRGEQWQERFRRSMDRIGDLDGDGIDEIAICCRGEQHPDGWIGRVLVYSPGQEQVVLRLEDGQPGHEYAFRTARAGDLDGDGVPDILVSAFMADGRFEDEGRVLAYSGASGEILFDQYGIKGGILLGSDIACAGDVDGDGSDDILIGARLANYTGFKSGRVALFSGRHGDLIRLLDGHQTEERFGFSVANAGDVDGDGVPDQAIGAQYATYAFREGGAVYYHSGASGKLIGRLDGDNEGLSFGFLVRPLGDLDGDGRHEIGVGVPNNFRNGGESGSVRVISSRYFLPD